RPRPAVAGGWAVGGWAVGAFALALVAAGLGRGAIGAGRYEPEDPCTTSGLDGVSLLAGPEAVVQAVGLDALANAACGLDTTREWLVLALDPDTALGPASTIPEDDIADALRAGVDTSLTNAEEDGTLPPIVTGIAREALAEVDILEWIEDPTIPSPG
ncbi:MAG: hypothetical protein S0880_26380, partial [Actinomycetota bacterium]|nr:hypothetical protein [Actinomycetota bacterium]